VVEAGRGMEVVRIVLVSILFVALAMLCSCTQLSTALDAVQVYEVPWWAEVGDFPERQSTYYPLHHQAVPESWNERERWLVGETSSLYDKEF